MIKSLMLAAVLAATAAPALAQSNTMSSGAASSSSGMSSSNSMSSSGSAMAAKPNPAMAKVGVQCKADFAKSCPNLKPGTPEMTQCVRDNFAGMSEGCQGALMEYMQSQGG